MEIYEDWLSSKMTRAELNELSDDDKKERKRLKQVKADRKYRENNIEKSKEKSRKYRENNIEKLKEKSKKYYENNPEYFKEYSQTPIGKKNRTINKWNCSGLQESKEELDRIYELWQTQSLCNACDCVLTRDGACSTQACMDHDHDTNRFRHIICRSCNTHDNWKKYFC